MLPTIFAWFQVLIAVPQPAVNWVNGDALHIVAEGREELLQRCLASGIEVRYRFELRMCRRRSAWFDDCENTRKEIHTVQFDPVSESYSVTIDRHADETEPETTSQATSEEAMSKVSTIDKFPINFLTPGMPNITREGRYVGVRVVADCKNSFGTSILDISSLLTLGLVKIDRFDSGWIAFDVSSSR